MDSPGRRDVVEQREASARHGDARDDHAHLVIRLRIGAFLDFFRAEPRDQKQACLRVVARLIDDRPVRAQTRLVNHSDQGSYARPSTLGFHLRREPGRWMCHHAPHRGLMSATAVGSWTRSNKRSREALGTPHVLVAVRGIVERQLSALPAPLGFQLVDPSADLDDEGWRVSAKRFRYIRRAPRHARHRPGHRRQRLGQDHDLPASGGRAAYRLVPRDVRLDDHGAMSWPCTSRSRGSSGFRPSETVPHCSNRSALKSHACVPRTGREQAPATADHRLSPSPSDGSARGSTAL